MGTKCNAHDTKGGSIYVRRIKSGGRGWYFQLVESYRDEGTKMVKKRVLVHLGEQPTVDDALSTWPTEVAHLRRIGRDNQADKLAAKLETLRRLTKGER